MKTLTQFKPLFASLMLGTALTLAPVAAFADTNKLQSNVGVATVITTDGFVRVAGATITAISGNVINATTSFGNNILNWILNVGADTNIFANGTAHASSTALSVGDTIHFRGALASTTGPTLVVAAKNIFDASDMKDMAHIKGTVTTISTSTNSFTLIKKDGATVTVNTDAGTIIKMNGAVGTFGSLTVGSTVQATGHLNTSKTVLSATKVTVKNSETRREKNADDRDDNRDSSKHENRGLHLGGFLNLNNFLSNDR